MRPKVVSHGVWTCSVNTARNYLNLVKCQLSKVWLYQLQSEMWPSFCQFMVYPQRLYIPVQTIPFQHITFPVVQSYSTLPAEVNNFEKETVPRNNKREPNYGPERIQSQQQLTTGIKLPQDFEEELLNITKMLLSKIELDVKVLEREIRQKFAISAVVGEHFFRNLISKLKKLTKTKEEIIKYCIRKSFKFINDKVKEGTCVIEPNDILKEFLKSMYENEGQSVPFRKYSNFKTMNSTFLMQLFSSQKFTEMYHEFLQVFPKICEADNQKKVENLVKLMANHLEKSSRGIKKFTNFKRIPWAQPVLTKSYEIAQDLLKYATKQNQKTIPTSDQ